MKKSVVLIATLASIGAVWAISPQEDVLDFRNMVGVVAPYTGTTNPIRGVVGPPGPWTIEDAKGELRSDGQLRVTVRGLVLGAGPLTGQNPLPVFRAIVSCQSSDSTGAPTVANIQTNDFPATPAGDAHIEEVLTLPSPCIAPIVFVTSSNGLWLAITGR